MNHGRMETRSFDSLMGRTIELLPGDGERYRFTFESVFGPSAVLKPLDLKSAAYAKTAEQKAVVTLEASIDGGKASAEGTVERWSERSGALRVYRPREIVLAQRRRHPRFAVQFPLELGVLRDGEMRTIRTTTEDLSVGGFAAVVDEQLEADEAIVVLVRLPAGVVIVTALGTMGERARRRRRHARFTAISPDDAAALAAVLHEVELSTTSDGEGRR